MLRGQQHDHLLAELGEQQRTIAEQRHQQQQTEAALQQQQQTEAAQKVEGLEQEVQALRTSWRSIRSFPDGSLLNIQG